VLHGRDGDGPWLELLPRTPLLRDNRHLFPVPPIPVTTVRLDILPDGGMARVRLHGTPTPDGRAALAARWEAAR
jgi:allantoicase